MGDLGQLDEGYRGALDVAIIGMSCRFPGANTVDELWRVMTNGENHLRPPPEERYYMGESGNRVWPRGYLSCPVDEFDAPFFNLNRRQAEFMDPQMRLFLEVAWESLEDARIPPSSLWNTDTGVFVGVCENEYQKLTAHEITSDSTRMYSYMGTAWSAYPGTLSFFLGLNGPSIASESACSSSGSTLYEVVQFLRKKDCTIGIVAATNLRLKNQVNLPDAVFGEACKAFDESASGFAVAEGVAAIIVKLLEKAKNDGDRILGVIKGVAINNCGYSRSFGTPNPTNQAKVLKGALADAAVEPHDIGFVVAHGTGTPVGDPLEVQGLGQVFANPNIPRPKPLIVTSAKTNFGHSVATSGLHSLIHTLLCFKHNIIPPQIHLTKLNPQLKLDSIPVIIPTQPIPYLATGKPRLTVFNNFGLTGVNAAVVLAEPPPTLFHPLNTLPQKLPFYFIPISTKCQNSLNSIRHNLKTKLERECPEMDEFAFSLQTTRTHHSKRIAVLARDRLDAIDKLSATEFEFEGDVSIVGGESADPIGFLFTGQGAEYFEVAKGLYNGSPVFRALFDPCAALFKRMLGKSIRELVWEDENTFDSLRPKWRQPAIFVIQYVLGQLWIEGMGVRPTVVLGHSLGEICCAVSAGVFSFEDGLRAVIARGELVESLEEGGMMAVGTEEDKIIPFIQGFNSSNKPQWVDLAAVNSKKQCVVSGPKQSLVAFKSFVLDSNPGLKMKILPTTHAFHSRHIDKISQSLKTAFERIECKEPFCTFVSSVTGQVETQFTGSYWTQNMRQPVYFHKALKTLLNLPNAPKIFIEIGPQPALLNFVSEASSEPLTLCPSLRQADPQGWPTLLKSLAKLYTSWNGNINWATLHGGHRPNVIDLPFYPFNRKVYNIALAKVSPGGLHNEFVHPLLGWAIHTLHSSIPAFKNTLSLSHPQVGFIKGHQVIGKVIFPGACFVEMLLSAQKHLNYQYLSVTDVKFSKTLEFEDGKPVDIEVTFTESQSFEGHEATLWVKRGDSLEKYFTGSMPKNPTRLVDPPKLDMNFLKEEGIPVAFYPKATEAGLEYQDLFQSIEVLWPLEQYSVARMKRPQDTDVHIIHPALLDGMIHSTVMDPNTSEYKNFPSFCIPAKFDYCHIYKTQSETKPPLYIKLDKRNSDTTELYDSQGTLIAACKIVEYNTTRAKFEVIFKTTNQTLLDFYTESWIPLLPKIQNGHKEPIRNPVLIQWLILTPNTTQFIAQVVKEQITQHLNVNAAVVVAANELCLITSPLKIDPLDLSHHQLLAKQFPSLEGVISLWGLGDEAMSVAGHLEKEVTKSLIGGFLNTLKFVGSLTETKNLLAITRGAIEGGSGSLSSNFMGTILHGSLKTFVSEYPHVDCIGIDLDPKEDVNPLQIAQQILSHIPYAGIEREVVIRQGKSSCARLVPFNPSFIPEEFHVPSGPFALKATGLGGLRSYEPKLLPQFDTNETVIKVESISLNFLQVVIHRNLLEGEKGFSGSDFAGIVEQVGEGSHFALGDRVCGTYHRMRHIGSHLTPERAGFVFRIPSWISYDEGSTLPIPLCTAYFGMYVRGKLKTGDRVLIHTASGGFGLAAIQLARHVGATVFATAGSERKRAYLRSVVGLEYVYNSRDTIFHEQILKVTKGEGIDLVVNTITGEGLKEASLGVVRRNGGGRFIELSKINIWTNEVIVKMRPDVEYTIYDLKSDFSKDMSPIEELLCSRAVRGMPYRVKPIHEFTRTLNEFSESKHIGKFVLHMSAKTRLFHPENSYLITGGLGGIGLVVAEWLIEQGAGKVILTGRSSPANSKVLEKVAQFGESAVVILADVGEKEGVRHLFKKIKAELPPLKGIFHAAGLLRDGVISGLSVTNFEEAFQSKVEGTWNLHLESLSLDLDHFVLFSSIASNVGLAGQAAYTAANNFLDTFVHYRVHELGLPATGINWGGWLDVGIAVNQISPDQVKYLTERSGIHWFTPAEGIEALERAIRLGLNQASILRFDVEKMGVVAYPKLHAYFTEVRKQKESTGRVKAGKKEEGNVEKRNVLAEMALKVKGAEETEKLLILEGLIEKCVRMYMSFPDDESINRGHSLPLYGMDSLMELEITNRLSKELSIVIPRGKLREQQTISALAGNLISAI